MEDLNISREKLHKLVEMTLNVNEDLTNTDVVIQKVLHSIEIVLDCESTSYLEFDRATNNLVFRLANGPDSYLIIGLAVPEGKGIAHKVLRSKKGIMINNTGTEDDHYSDIDEYLNNKTKNILAFPVFSETGTVFGVVEACNKRGNVPFTDEDFYMFSLLCQQAERSIRHTQSIVNYKEKISEFYRQFSEILYPPFIHSSRVMKRKLALARKLADSEAPILLTGEVGVGKKLFAYHIHTWSSSHLSNPNNPSIIIDCKALTAECDGSITKLEKVLFGEKVRKTLNPGAFLKAQGSTIILAEISAFPLFIQEKIYECLRNKRIFLHNERIEYRSHVRCICTSSVSLEEQVEMGTFLEKLYLHINTLCINIPPLGQRVEDVPSLARYYFSHFAKKFQKEITHVEPAVYLLLRKYSWPHSVNELINVISNCVLLLESPNVTKEDISIYKPRGREIYFPNHVYDITDLKTSMEEFKKSYIYNALVLNGWNCTKTASILDIQRSYLSRLVRLYRLKNKKDRQQRK